MTSDDIKRLYFYERQFLGARDFQEEQSYHIEMRRRHSIAHHSWGIVAGLEIIQDSKSKLWYVEPGVAVDGFGREIIVFDPEPLDTTVIADQLAGAPKPALLKVWISYKLEKSNRPAPFYEVCDAEDQFMRLRETFRLIYQDDPLIDLRAGAASQNPDDPDTWPRAFQDLPDDPKNARWPVYLGTLTWKADENNLSQNIIAAVTAVDPNDNKRRHYVGVIAEEIQAPDNRLLIRGRGNASPLPGDVNKPDYNGLPVKLEGSLVVDRQLNVINSAGIGIGTIKPDAKLQVSGGTVATLQNGSGHIVIGPVNAKNLVIDDNKIMARNNEQTSEMHLQLEGGGLTVHKNKAGSEIVIKDSGRVGIGTQNPARFLHVEPTEIHSGGSSGGFSFGNRGTSGFIESPANGERWVWYASGGTAHLWSGETKLSVTSDGHVGIGVANPSRALHVEPTEIHSGGGAGGFSFGNRGTPGFVGSPANGERWVWYASGGTAHLWSGSNKLSVSPSGNLTVTGNRTYLLGLDGNSYHWIMAGGMTENQHNAIGLRLTNKMFHTGPGWTKGFFINHPLDPEHKNLVHSTLEGPEATVFYRGEAQLTRGEAVITLPDYFEALTRKENRTVLITPKFEAIDPVSSLAASEVKDGKFTVKKIAGRNQSQKFYWEVKAVRSDVAVLEVESAKSPTG